MRLGADVRLQAAARPAPAALAAVVDRRVAPLARAAGGAAVGRAVGDHRRADTGADQQDHRVPRARGPRRTTSRPGPASSRRCRRTAAGRRRASRSSFSSGNAVPADGLARAPGPARPARPCRARRCPRRARRARRCRRREHLAQPGVTCATTVAGSGAGRTGGGSTVASRFIARSNSSTLTPVSPMSTPTTWPYAGSTRSSTRGRPPSDSTWPASTMQPSSHQFGGHVADRGGAQAGELAEFVPRQRAVEVQFRQQEGAVVPPQITDGGALARHGQPI